MSSTMAFSWLVTLRLSSRRCWTSWRLTRSRRRQVRTERRLVLLHRQLDSQLLLQKEQEQQVVQLEHRLQEMEESRLFRSQGSEPPAQLERELGPAAQAMGLLQPGPFLPPPAYQEMLPQQRTSLE